MFAMIACPDGRCLEINSFAPVGTLVAAVAEGLVLGLPTAAQIGLGVSLTTVPSGATIVASPSTSNGPPAVGVILTVVIVET